MKLYQCECEYVLFPFGNYAPICARVYFQTGKYGDLIRCVEKGCEHYKKKIWKTKGKCRRV